MSLHIKSGGRRQKHTRTSALAAAAVQALERRVMLTTDVTYVPATGAPVEFSWDVLQDGRSVVDSPTAQRSLLLATTAESSNDVFLRLDGIPGASIDGKHPGEIDVLSYEWGSDREIDSAQPGGPDFN